MLFISNNITKKYIKKYKCLANSPIYCPACKIATWENATFQYWLTKDHVGFFRTCEKCSKFQTVLTPRNLKEMQKLNNFVFNVSCGYEEINMQTITNIKEIEEKIDYTSYSGYLIEADKKIRHDGENHFKKIYYVCMIDNDQQCCEEFGYLSTPDDYKSFIGSEMYSYEIVDVNEDEQKLNFKTSKGDLQFSAYNNHNGYYYHRIIVKKLYEEQLEIDMIDDCFYDELIYKVIKK